MGQKRTSYKRRIGAGDRIKREALRILPTLCPAEHLQALAQLDQAIKNGQAKWAQDADTDDTPHLGDNGTENDFKRPDGALEGQDDPL